MPSASNLRTTQVGDRCTDLVWQDIFYVSFQPSTS
ncbi:hypothetical protein T11_976 [Trichinella zimbabwensis]|uniref:Uncharacterized protein n=1 Tax=Trichinella zimbabwensis TaxID=268475 RepID=A0A0V1DPH8_9BILA|nr:hypothetical protein T11_976 [Trichinella zimbabwensis]